MADEPKSKLIIDEDWKRQAQAEKEALAMKAQAEAAAKGASALPPAPSAQAATQHSATEQPAAAQPSAPSAESPEPLPPASLTLLFSALTTQALVSLGQIAHPLTGKAELDLDHARHQIDMLGMLEEKTQGNRTPDESQILSDLLHDLRMTFVAVQRHLASQPQQPLP